MHKRNSLGLCLVIVIAIHGVSPFSNADESKEPKLKYELKIGDKTVTVAEGETVKVEGQFSDPSVNIIPGKTRTFPYSGMSFAYPSNFVFEADMSDAASTSWTLSGNDFVVMIFHLEAEMTTDMFANEMIGQFGSANAKIANEKLNVTLGDHELSGTQLEVSIASHKLVQKIVKIPSKNGQTKLLVFQDSLNDDGSHSAEAKKAMKTIASTFKAANVPK